MRNRFEPLRVVLVAREAAGVQVLRLLGAGASPVLAVLTDPAPSNPVARAAADLGVEVWPERMASDTSFADTLRSLRADILLNVHSLRILPEPVIAAPRIGSFNLRPGPLPAYAGLNAPSWAIYNGEGSHGVTLHWMSAEVDAGEIAYARGFPIGPGDSALAVSLECVRSGVPLVKRLLEAAAEDSEAIPRVAQDRSLRRFHERHPPVRRVDWSAPARRILDFVRACDYHPFTSPWGHPEALAAGRTVAILAAEATGMETDRPPGAVRRRDGEGVWISARDEWVRVTHVSVDGCRRGPADLLWPSERTREGAVPAPTVENQPPELP